MASKLVAPEMDKLLKCFGKGWKNATPPTRAVLDSLDPLFDTLRDLAPLKRNDEAKAIWLMVPRGGIDDFDDYDKLREWGEVSSREEYNRLWEEEYPEELCWYELAIAETDTYRGVSVGRTPIVSARLGNGYAESDWLEAQTLEICKLLTRAAEESMRLLRAGMYNAIIQESLPYYHRTGVIKRSVLRETNPEERKSVFDGLSEDVFEVFKEYASSNAEDETAIGRLKSMTGNNFFEACSLGYKACGYSLTGNDGAKLAPIDLYLRYADGRDEGLTGKGHGLCSGPGIDLASGQAWDHWFFDMERSGGHPWEVCRGGNSTHVSLRVCHDKPELEWRHHMGEISDEQLRKAANSWGYYYAVAGDAWNRSVESVNFYVALKRAGLPVILHNADAILARFEGRDFIGIVPRSVIPVYCANMFPDRYGTILDFMHVYDEDIDAFGEAIEWLPEEEAELLADGSFEKNDASLDRKTNQ